jgi:hypothetical protein
MRDSSQSPSRPLARVSPINGLINRVNWMANKVRAT